MQGKRLSQQNVSQEECYVNFSCTTQKRVTFMTWKCPWILMYKKYVRLEGAIKEFLGLKATLFVDIELWNSMSKLISPKNVYNITSNALNFVVNTVLCYFYVYFEIRR